MTIPPEIQAALWSLAGALLVAIRRRIGRFTFWRSIKVEAAAELGSPDPATTNVPELAVVRALARRQRRQIRDTVRQLVPASLPQPPEIGPDDVDTIRTGTIYDRLPANKDGE